MTDVPARLGLGAGSIALTWYQHTSHLITKDGERLLARPRPAPFHTRWLMPTCLGDRQWLWALATWAFLLGTCLLFPGGVWACALWVALPWFRAVAQCPVLVDGGAVFMSLAAARWPAPAHWYSPNPPLALSLLGGSICEKAPVFAALYAWRWELLLGLAMPVMLAFVVKGGPRDSAMGALATGRARAMRLADLFIMVLPWGAGLAALFDPHWTLQEIVTVAVAYGQLFVAYDSSRLYQWSAPVVIPKAIGVLPRWALLPAVVVTWVNPFGATMNHGEVQV
jgi:hypothetical protein